MVVLHVSRETMRTAEGMMALRFPGVAQVDLHGNTVGMGGFVSHEAIRMRV